jgi:hypothetical protein
VYSPALWCEPQHLPKLMMCLEYSLCVLLKEVVTQVTFDKNKNRVTIIIQNLTLPEKASNAEFK